MNNYTKIKGWWRGSLCIKDSLLYKRREDLDKSNVDIECVFIELDKGTLKFNRDVIIEDRQNIINKCIYNSLACYLEDY